MVITKRSSDKREVNMVMRLLLVILISLFAINFSCQKETKESAPKKIQSKTGVEGTDATSQEVDTLNKKMDELMQGVQ